MALGHNPMNGCALEPQAATSLQLWHSNLASTSLRQWLSAVRSTLLVVGTALAALRWLVMAAWPRPHRGCGNWRQPPLRHYLSSGGRQPPGLACGSLICDTLCCRQNGGRQLLGIASLRPWQTAAQSALLAVGVAAAAWPPCRGQWRHQWDGRRRQLSHAVLSAVAIGGRRQLNGGGPLCSTLVVDTMLGGGWSATNSFCCDQQQRTRKHSLLLV